MAFKINHVNLNVTDLDKSLEFYRAALGLKLVRRHDADDGSFSLAFISDETEGFRIELTWLRDKEGPYELGDNESHIAFIASKYEEAYNLHKQMGIICYENKNMGLYFIEDPDGYWMEICPDRTGD